MSSKRQERAAHERPARRRPLLLVLGLIGAAAALGVTAFTPGQAGFTLRPVTAERSAAQGASADYPLRLTSYDGFAAEVALSAADLPAGVTATFAPAVVRLDRNASTAVTLTLATAPETPAGPVPVTVVATGGGFVRSAQLRLTVTSTQRFVTGSSAATLERPRMRGGARFGISGDLAGTLHPGASHPLDLVLTNPGERDLAVTDLSVQLSTARESACTADNYDVVPYSGSYPLELPAGTTRRLSELRPASVWPHIRMRNLPRSQDACRSAVLTLTYTGRAEER